MQHSQFTVETFVHVTQEYILHHRIACQKKGGRFECAYMRTHQFDTYNVQNSVTKYARQV